MGPTCDFGGDSHIFASWLVFQSAGILYGCENDQGDPASADAYLEKPIYDPQVLVRKVEELMAK